VLIPPGIGKHKELNTSYTKFDQLLQDFSKNRFSGYIKIIFWGFEGIIVFDTGRMIQAFSSETTEYLTGEKAVIKIVEKSEETDGEIEVNELSSEVAISLGFAIEASSNGKKNTITDKNISEITKYFEKKQTSGFIDLQFNRKRGVGTIYFLGGSPVESIVMTNQGKTIRGGQVLKKVIEIENLIQSIEVHQIDDPKPIVQENAFIIPWLHNRYLKLWDSYLHYFENLIYKNKKKNNFYDNINVECKNLKNKYPFLEPNFGKVQIKKDEFSVSSIIHHKIFLDGMVALLRENIQKIPARRLRKIDFMQVISDLQQIAEKNKIEKEKIDIEKFVSRLFDGLI
jgi:hypothetical protein